MYIARDSSGQGKSRELRRLGRWPDGKGRRKSSVNRPAIGGRQKSNGLDATFATPQRESSGYIRN
jgi:hypothetical protein